MICSYSFQDGYSYPTLLPSLSQFIHVNNNFNAPSIQSKTILHDTSVLSISTYGWASSFAAIKPARIQAQSSGRILQYCPQSGKQRARSFHCSISGFSLLTPRLIGVRLVTAFGMLGILPLELLLPLSPLEFNRNFHNSSLKMASPLIYSLGGTS
jgi:hypothetical protein